MPDVQHAQTPQHEVASWRDARVSEDATHHCLGSKQFYSARFDLVREFHEPGLAPARDGTGAFHIDAMGMPVYGTRYAEAWGFYEGLAAVEHPTGGWLHIRTNGSPLYPERHEWCGNYQESRCAVRVQGGLYCHIDIQGKRLSNLAYLYAGDFRERAAVVRHADDGFCGHINDQGLPLHGRRFIDLDVFHKGFARARDQSGWFHVCRDGREAYSARFASVEPFYNGTALAETITGDRVLITHTGAVGRVIVEGSRATLKQHVNRG